jgi:hypothetical protein
VQAASPPWKFVGASEQHRPAQQLVFCPTEAGSAPVEGQARIQAPAVRPCKVLHFFLGSNTPLKVSLERRVAPQICQSRTKAPQAPR